jgi:hypothetical protein
MVTIDTALRPDSGLASSRDLLRGDKRGMLLDGASLMT